MGTLTTIVLVILGISFMTFVTFFGRLPALRRTPISWLYRLIWVKLPNSVLAVDQKLTSGRVTSSCSRMGNFIMYERHPTVLIFFLLLLSVGEYMYLPTAWPQLSTLQKTTGSISIALPYIFLYLAAFSDPGFITPDNHAHEMARYPFDYTVFHPGIECYTCRLLKPARSKHCTICKRCIGKLDHHCIFINNCVGRGNHHWFILLLLSTAILTLYGGVLGIHLMTTKMRARFPYWALLPRNANGGRGIDLKQWLIVWGWGMQDSVSMGAVTLLTLMTTPLVWGLLGYHLWLIYCGTTTNESMKWSDWQAEMDDGFAFKRNMPADRIKNTLIEPGWSRWPVETEQILVRTEDGKPPHPDLDIPGVGEWEPVWRLKDIENLYDIGFLDNLIDVFSPGYMFRDPQTPTVEGKLRRRKKRRPRG
ncbi:DHHC palmitoyltransferase-domain-containing protein [Cercophora newfieldiana]|uniref:Palmitoyltransferase n=1 Tax=Cercophora newfieldiana TaxID=92897 RepID=A0AA40CLD4_9PEZI|nr:DHHC palmitoyltransferase-domain-containing protein [Cercophora newfieldiana]